MKHKIGIGLLIIINLIFVYVMVLGTFINFGIIVAELGHDQGLIAANNTINEIVKLLAILTVIVLLISYIITRKLIENKKPLIISLVVTTIAIMIYTPFFLSARQSFINYQDGTTQLRHYLNRSTITEVQIIRGKDTTQVEDVDYFIDVIGFAKYKPGHWKYAKKMKLKFRRIDGSRDSVFTNGQIFGPYNGKYFSTKENVVDNYLLERKQPMQ